MKTIERERRDWMIIPIILVIGFLCVLVAGQWALRFSPRWQLNANMDSNLDPNSDFLTSRPNGFIEPVDPSILTQPVWVNAFLTPGATFVTGTLFPPTTVTLPVTGTATPTMLWPVTSTAAFTAIPTNTFVNLPWVSTPTPKPPNTNHPTEMYTPISTPTISATATATFTATATPTSTTPPVADLQITISDGATDYVPNSTRTYTIIASNPLGPSGVNGATVTFTLPPQISGANWSCAGAGGGVCTASGTGNINDLVNLPINSSITYTINVTIAAAASGDLVNTASVIVPTGFTDPTPGNDSWTDTDILITADPPPGQIAVPHDSPTYNLTSGSTLTLNTSVAADGDVGVWDLVYYELPAGSGIMMDHVIIELSDGYNWYTILNWGDTYADTHTNININSIGGAEDDNRDIASVLLHDTTGVAIDLDLLPIPAVTYSYIRITAPAGDSGGDGCDIDAIVILP